MNTVQNKFLEPSGKRRYSGKRTFVVRFKIVLCIVLLILALGNQKILGQGVGISEVSIAPDATSILELRSSLRGFLAPRMTTAERMAIASPAQGLLVFDTTTKTFWYYDSGWKSIAAEALGASNQLLGMNFAGTANEYKTLNGTPNQVNVTHGVGLITLSTPQDIHSGASPTFFGLTLSGLTPNAGVYTNGTSRLTSTPPTSGTIGYWDRTGTVLSPTTAGDAVTTSGNIYTTGTGTITSAGLLTGQAGATISGGAINLNNNSNFVTNINTGTSTGNVTIGNSANSLYLPKFTMAGLLHNNATGLITSSQVSLTADVINVLPVINGGTGQSTYNNGELLIGNSAGSLTRTTLTGTINQVNVTNGNGSITLSTPQNIHSGASPTFFGLTLSGLTPNSGVYTNGTSGLTSTPPTSGTIGYWDRTGTVLSPTTAGDAVMTSGNIYTTGTGTITSAGLLTGQAGATVSGGAINLNNNSNFATNINTGTSSGAVTIGNSANTITLPAFTTAGVVHNNNTGLLSTGQIVNSDITNGTIDLTSKVTGILPVANGGTNSGTALINGRVMVSRGGQIVEAGVMNNGQVIVGSTGVEPQIVTMGGDISIDNTGVTTIGALRVQNGMLADNSVTSNKIQDGQVLTADIADANVTNTKLSANAVTTDKILDGTIVNADINAAAQIDATKLIDGSVSNTELGYINTLTSNAQTQLDNIGTQIIGINTLADGKIYVGDATNTAQEVFVTGDITMTNTGLTTISNNAVTTGKILDGTILNADIADGTIDLTQKVTSVLPIANGGTNSGTALVNGRVMVSRGGQIIEAGHLNSGQVIVGSAGDPQLVTMNGDITIDDLGATTIGAGRVQNGMLADNSVTSNKIQDGQVMTADIADANVTTIKIADGNVTNGKLAADAVTTDKISDGTIINGDINAAAQIDATKLIDGSVSNTELGYINTLTSNAQTQLDNIGTQIIGINTLADGKIYVGDATNTAQEVFVTGDITMTNTGLTTISNNAVTTGKILDGTILNGDIADGTIDLTQKVMNVLPIANGGTNSGTALVNGRVMVSRGGQIVEAGVMNNGQVIVGSTGVEPQIVTLGGDATINTTGSLTLANTGVANATYGDATHVGRFTVDSKGRLTFAENVVVTGTSPIGSALTNNHIWLGNNLDQAAEAILSGDITTTNTGVTTISNDAVTSAKILNGTILNEDIANTTIDLTQKVMNVLPIANGGTNSGTALVNGRVMVSRAGQIVEAGHLNTGQLIVGSAGDPVLVTMNGDITIDDAGAALIGAGAVNSGKISDGTILNIDIGAGAAIDATKLANGAVDNAEYDYLNGVTSPIQTQFTNVQTDLVTEVTRATTAEGLLTTNLNNEVTRATAAEGVLTADLSTEVTRATTAETTLTTNLGNEVTRAQAAEGVLTTNLAAEVTRATGAETTLTTNLNSEVTRATAAEGVLTTNLSAEVTRATAAENTLTTNLATEVTNRTSGDASLQTELDATQTGAGLDANGGYTANGAANYISGATSLKVADNLLDAQVKLNTDAIASGNTNIGNLQTEVDNIETGSGLNADGTYTANGAANYISGATSLKVADNLLDTQLKTTTDNLSSEVTRATAAEGVLTTNLAAEVTRATGAETTLTTNLNSEVTRATAAEGVLTTNLSAEVTRATAAENTLTTNLATEVTNRTNGDAALQTELDATQTGAGLNANGTYTANGAANYISGATSLKVADNLLDAQVKLNTDAIASGNTNIGNLQTEVDNIETGSGLNADGTYTANGAANYISGATSLKVADNLLDTQLKTTTDNLASEVTRATGAETTLTTNLNSEVTRATAAEGVLTTNLSAEVTRATAAEGTLTTNLATEVTNRTNGDASLQTELDATQTGAGLNANGTYTANGAANYISGATSLKVADNLLDAQVKLNTDAIASGNTIIGNLQTEVDNIETGSGLNADGTYTANGAANYISGAASLKVADNLLDTQLKTTTDNLASEVTRATAAESVLTTNLSAEVTRATAAESTLTTSLATEVTNRTTADAGIQTELDATQTGAGLNANGTYTANGAANYINGATSLKIADNLLDAQVKLNTDAIASGNTNIGNLQTEVDNIETGSGLNADGTYTANGAANYISTAASLKVADNMLDTQVKLNADNIALKANISGQVFTGAISATNLSGTNTGDNTVNTTSNTYADGKVADAINNGTTTIAPSQNAVFDALALKAATNQSFFIGTTSIAINRASAAQSLTGITSIDGSAAKWTTARNLAGNSVDGSADVNFANKFIVQGTIDAGLPGAQFLGALGTGLVKNTTTTGVLSIASAGTDYVAPNAAIAGDTKTKITYDSKGLITAGADATTADIAPSINRNYVNDGQLTLINNTSGTNTGDLSLTAIGSTPSANGASLSGQALTLQPADATNGGVLTNGAQTIGGAKTFNAGLTVTGGIVNLNNDATANGVNIGTGTNTGTVAIGNGLNTISLAGTISGANPLVFDGATANANKTTFAITDPTAARTITFPDASGIVALVDAGASWLVNGNAGTSAATNFIGTTDNNDLVFRTNSVEKARIDNDSSIIKLGNTASIYGIIKANKELVLRQDGDVYGPSILRLRNRTGENGAIFETTDPAITLVDFIFRTAGPVQRNIRFEARANARTGSPSFHIGGTNPDNPTLSVGDNYSAFNKPLRIGNYTLPTALLHLAAGTATANTAPLKFTSGPLLTTAEPGAVEFLTDKYYGTITTGAARRTFAFLESPIFTTPNIGAATGTSLTVTGALSSSGTAGIGYSTGAGGTVLQATSKFTPVTIDKICGVITTSGSWLNNNTSVSFTVNNNLVTATDVPVVAFSGGTTRSYIITVTAVAGGSFEITIYNITGGGRGEILYINFAIVKTVNS